MGPKKKQGQRESVAVRSALIFAAVALLAMRAWPQSRRAPAPTSQGEIILRLDPAQSQLRWTLGSTLHTVHGTFALKPGLVSFDPANGNASGEIAADAASGESGNESRDKKMHNEILESRRYPQVIFRCDRIEGKVLAQGSSSVQVHGIFVLHGAEHELTVPVQAELAGDYWKGSAKFSVPYIQWGLKSPNTFLLKADPVVEIELEMSGKLQMAAAP
ncbi:MAG: YceI family protein [Candidatus Acidiferrum sp.]